MNQSVIYFTAAYQRAVSCRSKMSSSSSFGAIRLSYPPPPQDAYEASPSSCQFYFQNELYNSNSSTNASCLREASFYANNPFCLTPAAQGAAMHPWMKADPSQSIIDYGGLFIYPLLDVSSRSLPTNVRVCRCDRSSFINATVACVLS